MLVSADSSQASAFPAIRPALPATRAVRRPSHPTTDIDPRWVLANRTAELMQGAILTPEHRQTLGRLGAMLGLTPFDTALVMAVVQDQARRGRPARHGPLAAYPTLRAIGQPRRATTANPEKTKRIWYWIVSVALTITIELAIVAALL